ncbi:hypothetical protein SBF1_8580002 [Candidatus Desulfosporosinus infrequens]|uniref:Uncharacterized protein n=1 Tax=Candidatus Desulfosporosinus infrequens TaxID=2043169 RepID=A0A2U3LUZ1_9FIRM|nr:hypothetical protein SBF1_8580002 [Candidatus Desulfosporosinus infrequens]
MITLHDDGTVDVPRHDFQFVLLKYAEIVKHSGHSITVNVNEDEGIAKMTCNTCQSDLLEVEVEGTITKWSKDGEIIKRWREQVN